MANATSRAREDMSRWLPLLGAAPAVGLVALGVFAGSLHSGSVFAVGLLVAGAAFLAGALLGFLFGIPRLLAADGTAPAPQAQDDAHRSPYRTNTNLEQISDWLTKILVGVGLVELATLSKKTRELVDYLAPALGGVASSPAVALTLLTVYGISGFLIVYLITRVYLGRVFAQADELMQRLDEVEATQQQQQKDVEALTAVSRHVEDDAEESRLSQTALDAAVAAASGPVKTQIFNFARERRRFGRPEQGARTEAVFRALIAADTTDAYHRNHAQLAYLLFGQRRYADAEAALTTAIERRDHSRARGYRIYEYMRAQSRIAQEPADAPSAPDVAAAVLADLRTAAQTSSFAQEMRKEKRVSDWLERNHVDAATLQPAA